MTRSHCFFVFLWYNLKRLLGKTVRRVAIAAFCCRGYVVDEKTVEVLSKTDDPAYAGKLWIALALAVWKAFLSIFTGGRAAFYSGLMSGFGTAASTAGTRTTGVRKIIYLPLRIIFGGAAALATMGLCLFTNKESLTADQCDIAAALFLRFGLVEDALEHAREGLGREGSRPNTRALLTLRRLEAQTRLISKEAPGTFFGTFCVRSDLLREEYEELEGALYDFDPQNRSRFYRSHAEFLALRDERAAALAARTRAVELAKPWPDQLAKAQAIRFDWE